MYILLDNNKVKEIIPDIDPAFTDIPIENRYPAKFVEQLIHVADNTDVQQRWVYDPESGTFSEPPATAPKPEPVSDLPNMKAAKQKEISESCHNTIVSGIDVELSDGSTGHFSLQEVDQINLAAAVAACQQGASEYPYHADGKLCRMYSAADIAVIDHAAAAHKLYHTTYCNHLLAWARRAETADALTAVVYGADLPADLAKSMAALLEGGTP